MIPTSEFWTMSPLLNSNWITRAYPPAISLLVYRINFGLVVVIVFKFYIRLDIFFHFKLKLCATF